MHGVAKFNIKSKLAPRHVGLFEIVERIDDVACRLSLPPRLSHVHDIFHVSMLKKYTFDPSHVLPYIEIPIQPNVTYEK